MWSIEKLLRKLQVMLAMKANLMHQRRVLYCFFWSVDFLSRVSALASSFGVDINCTDFRHCSPKENSNSIDFHDSLNWINGYLCRLCSLLVAVFLISISKWLLNLARHELRYHQLCSLISQRITKRTQRGSRFIKSPVCNRSVQSSRSISL
jgi:hypothetical protein